MEEEILAQTTNLFPPLPPPPPPLSPPLPLLQAHFHFYPPHLPKSPTGPLPHPLPLAPNPSRGKKFLWYAPHSGFSNQLSEFKNAILMASILNRTLIVPPVLDHHAVALGSCPKFRVLSPNELRFSVWNHVIELIQSRRYVSMADIIDFSKVVSASEVQVIDFRVFISIWCRVNLDLACSEEPNKQSSLIDTLRQCGSLLSGYNGNVNNCLYALGEDCRTTVWTYGIDGEDGVLDSFQPDEQLKKKKKISYVRTRRDVYKTLGPGSGAESATVLAFGSLFTSSYKGSELYIDIHKAPRDQRMQSLIEKVGYLPFVPEIISAGKEFASETIKFPFLCAQLRLLDGQFKYHWKVTFQGLQQKIESLQRDGALPIHIFVMTDLPEGNWTGSYLGDLARDSGAFKLHVLRENDNLVTRTAKKLAASGNGKKFSYHPERIVGTKRHCHPPLLPDMLLYIEESVCSCASLGFVGTGGSTIAESIELMRKYGVCSG
ncbi:O-fucosyltransferase 30 [Actinidia eriantha]|uniref:O-fucosyltransferase 30 n=1 Tax=Actinidia eriantha TaxID=165200 RepID=UPI00258502E2|nr:O-fucosyltransferase 30 [Actinidia eriantha]